jgi:1-acyl-sn-glycerol-3-phosphate acyltransferase
MKRDLRLALRRADNPSMSGMLLLVLLLLLNASTLVILAVLHLLGGLSLGILLASNVLVIVVVCNIWPRYYVGLVTGVIRYGFYRFRVRGLENVPREGAAILVCNHVSYMDIPLLMAANPRPLVFWVHHRMFEQPVLGDFLRASGAIAVATKQQDVAHYDSAFQAAVQALQQGKLLVIFPEGRLTRDGQLQAFKSGVMKIAQMSQDQGMLAPVIPMALRGLWGSYFSWIEPTGPMTRPWRRGWRNPVELHIGEPMPLASLDTEVLRGKVAAMLDESMR